MKTSNKLLIAIGLLIVVAIVSFNMALKAEYLKGTYKSRYYNLVPVQLKDFDAIEDYTAHETFLDVTQSNKFEVWVDKEADKDMVLSVQNHVLKIDFKTVKSKEPRNHVIHITCPQLKSLVTEMRPGADIIYTWGSVSIGIYKQDALTINKRSPGTIYVGGNILKKLNVSMTDGDLTVGGTIKVDTANFDMRGYSKLTIDNIAIPKLSYKFADSAKVVLSGSSLKQLPK
jgi:hypothetical protein